MKLFFFGGGEGGRKEKEGKAGREIWGDGGQVQTILYSYTMEISIQGEGALPLVQSSISFLKSCFENHNFFLMWSPLSEETSFLTFSSLYFSHHYTYYILQIDADKK